MARYPFHLQVANMSIKLSFILDMGFAFEGFSERVLCSVIIVSSFIAFCGLSSWWINRS